MFREAERREARLARRQANLSPGADAATTVDELAEIRRDDRRELIEAAIAAGIDVDLSRFAPADAAYLASLGGLSWPLAQISITDVFGARGGRHMGLDLAAGAGTPIGSAAPGIVVLSSESYYGYGVAVIVQHLDGVQTLYGHMTNGTRQVKVGDWVEAGDVLGGVGNTGRSFGNHLHFEVRVGGVAQRAEVLQRAGLRVGRGMAAVGRAYRVRAARIVGARRQGVVGSLTERFADGVDRREVQHVETHVADGRQASDGVAERAVVGFRIGHRTRKQFVPAREHGFAAIDLDHEGVRRGRTLAWVGGAHELHGRVCQQQGDTLFALRLADRDRQAAQGLGS